MFPIYSCLYNYIMKPILVSIVFSCNIDFFQFIFAMNLTATLVSALFFVVAMHADFKAFFEHVARHFIRHVDVSIEV